MSGLYMVEIRPDLGALLRFLHGQGLDIGDHDEDLGYGVHAWLAAAFGQERSALALARSAPTDPNLGYTARMQLSCANNWPLSRNRVFTLFVQTLSAIF